MPRNVFQKFEGLGWGPVLDETLLIGGDYGIVLVAILWDH